ncbi:hypothetical protein [Paracoccus sediminicola]|uniref:hypothetical protein n=1 Tax=Paracoccus sediminicola TaxID=3017783 RepID=UPI0022F0F8AF|nr:hypothetical protein [Paracoccus sediminicola]WBU57618.1 hypothetical protein PAF18_04055 [Paracoccus sediminicola]
MPNSTKAGRFWPSRSRPAEATTIPRKPFLYEPLNRLKPLAEDLWIVDGPRISMNVGPFRTPFPTRMTVIRLPEGVFLHSPIAFDAGLAEAVAALGPVRWLIAPNLIHYASVQPWLNAFPEAESWASTESRRGLRGIASRSRSTTGSEVPRLGPARSRKSRSVRASWMRSNSFTIPAAP